MPHPLLIHCPDERGLICKITGRLYAHGLNTERPDEFVERGGNVLFMRTELAGAAATEALLAEQRAVLPAAGRNPPHRQP